ncbi:MAG: CCA tRNA nucleotidyltransferase [bacterium]|nr:CCA tRNA nucleotidyltransferase [bacterium]
MLSFITPNEQELLQRIAALAEREGMPLRVVGGFVRDRLLQAANRLPVPPKPEMDFVTTGDALKLAELVATIFPHARHYQYGHFGTARVDWKEWMFEFATARTESYQSDSRNPDVVASTFEEDAARRDFTVNALAWGVNGAENGVLFDPFGGVRDLEQGILRTPLDPGKTFSDDPLRMMRAARFVAKLNFSIDPVTENGITENAARIEIVHVERIADELLQTLAAPFPHLGIDVLFRTGVLTYILPEIVELHGVDQRGKHSHKDVYTHTLQVLENASTLSNDIAVRLSALFHDIAKPQTKKFLPEIGWTFYGHEVLGVRSINRVFRRLRLSNLLAKRVGKITRLHMRPVRLAQEGVTDSAIRRLRVEAGEELEALLQLCRADITSANPKRVEKYLKNYQTMLQRLDLVEKRDHLSSFQSPVRGEEIAELCGIPFGPRIGMIKTAIEEAILDGVIPNEYEPAKVWLLENRERLLSEPEQRIRKKSLEQLDEKQVERLLQAVKESHEQSESNE